MSNEDIKSMNVYQRMHGVMAEFGIVAKKGYNQHHKYTYAKESDFVEAIKPLLVKYRLFIIPQIDTLMHAPEKPTLVDIKMSYKIINIDNPNDFVVASMGGQGQDNGDKAVFKAITGAKKYFYSVTFVVPTGDDAEETSPEMEEKKPPKTSSFRKEAITSPVKEKKESNDGW